MKRIVLMDGDTGEVLAEWPRRKTEKNKNINEKPSELLAALAVALVGLILVVITE